MSAKVVELINTNQKMQKKVRTAYQNILLEPFPVLVSIDSISQSHSRGAELEQTNEK